MPFSEFMGDIEDFFETLDHKFRGENENRRREDRELEDSMEDNYISSNEPKDKSKVIGVNFQVEENAKIHNCDKYELITRAKNTAIVRRGGSLLLEIEMNQKVNLKNTQELTVHLSFGQQPLVNKGTKAVITFSGKKRFEQDKDDWDHRVISETDTKVVVEIYIPDDIPVGYWTVACETKSRSNVTERHLYRADGTLYILFNPWNKEDGVYMADEEKRQEYVLNDIGKIWAGGYPNPPAREWVFGQFDDVVLPACIIIIQRSGLRYDQMGDPVLVSRAISKMVNANDDTGVLVGKWDGKYEDGTAPSAWTGSIKILEEYIRKKSYVKYGQCWVFSGVTTTVCRALGIPCRSVTNLNSAHDTNMSLTIDHYFNKGGEKIKKGGRNAGISGIGDSIWNFHVWNDVWMTRPDIKLSGYGGWQAIDATPQEKSGGFMQCGPASLQAVKNGDTHLPYDVNFVLAEVNADIVNWQEDNTISGGFKKLTSEKTSVGVQVLTKKAGKTLHGYSSVDREECTLEYKAREGSSAERTTLFAAARRTRAARHAFRLNSEVDTDVEFKMEDTERVSIGEDFTVNVSAKNNSNATRTVSLVLNASSEYYNGNNAALITKSEREFSLAGGAKDSITLNVKHSVYYDKLVEYGMIKLRAIANIKETTQTWIADDTFQVIKPVIKIKISDDGVVGKPLPVKFSFKNPLDRVLRSCFLIIDGPGLTRPKKINLDDISANDYMDFKISIYPKRSGRRTLVATFNSTELVNITGSTPIDINHE